MNRHPLLIAGILASMLRAQPQPARSMIPLPVQAAATLAQHEGKLTTIGLESPVEVLRDKWGIAHIYAKNTHDLFFAQGFIAAQDHMWQMELWRRNNEGRLAEVLGPEYLQRDRFARLIAFHGDWNVEMRKYHPEGPVIFQAFADGVNKAIHVALEEGKVPIEFKWMGFLPETSWTAQAVLSRMPGWTLSRNVQRELARAVAIKAMGVEKAQQAILTEPYKAIQVPPGLDLDTLSVRALEIARNANDFFWWFGPSLTAAPPPPSAGLHLTVQELVARVLDDSRTFDQGSNNWVIGPSKSVTGQPILANDPHREVQNPALRMLVHLVAPGWNVIGATEPGLPGVSIGHNENIAWGLTILGVDQQDLYVEDIDPAHSDRYMYKGQWMAMESRRELIQIKGKRASPEFLETKRTVHGPVLYEDQAQHKAYALRWVGDEAGGAGYLGSLNVMQAKNWAEFTQGVEKSWYLPSHSLVYADQKGHYGYVAAGLSPVRKNWDGLLPVPGKDAKYEWDGFLPLEKLPRELDGSQGFYASANNDVVGKLFPKYDSPLGYEYSAPYRFDRITEVLSQNRKFSVADMEALQQDHLSIPARKLVPLLGAIKDADAGVRAAIAQLLKWDFVLDQQSATPTIYEYWVLKLSPMVYALHLPPELRASNRPDPRQVIEWLTKPGAEFGSDPVTLRNQMLVQALQSALKDLRTKYGADPSHWSWGSIHFAMLRHPLLSDATKSVLNVAPVSRGGDSYTVQATSSPTEENAEQLSGASAMMVIDTQDWDRSVGLNVPGNESQAGSPHADDLAPLWGLGKYFPLAFSRAKVEELTEKRLVLYPTVEHDKPDASDPFERVFTELFKEASPVAIAWGDYDNDGWPDLFIGYHSGLAKLFHNNHGHFEDVTLASGLSDHQWVTAAAWGDFDGDGNLDLYVGYAYGPTVPNRLYRNDGHGHFVDVAAKMGVSDSGETRQVSFVDFNNDGRLDLFVGFREKENRLYRNDGDHFTEVAKQMGITGAHSTVGAIWMDYNEDGRLDLFEANQNGAQNCVYRNDGDHFTEVAKQLGMDGGARAVELGSVGIAVGDYDNDGRLDLFYANYGPSWLMHNDGGGKFTDVAPETGVVVGAHLVSAGWADYDNDGRLDLYADGYLSGHEHVPDFLFHNDGDHFSDVTPGYMIKHDADHGLAWVDYDLDGAVDLSLADHESEGVFSLYHNRLPADRARKSLSVLVLDSQGHYTKAGSEVRVYKAGTRSVLGARLVDTGSGYDSQSAIPVYFGLPETAKVDVEVTFMTSSGRKLQRVAGVDAWARKGKPLVIKAQF